MANPVPTILQKRLGRPPQEYTLTEEKKQLVKDNIFYIWHYYKNYVSPHNPQLSIDLNERDEIISVMLLYLCIAAEKWNPERGKFTTCASLYFRAGISRYFEEKRKYTSRYVLVSFLEDFEAASAEYDDSFRISEVVSKDYSVSSDSLIDLIKKSDLVPIEKKVMLLIFQDGYSRKEVGEMMGKTRSRVGQIVKHATEILKEFVALRDIRFSDFFVKGQKLILEKVTV